MAIDDLEPLITEEPDPTHGFPIQLDAAEGGVWRFAVELADPTDPYVEWLDLTRFYRGDRHERGADQPKGRYAASTTRVELGLDRVQAEDIGVDINILAPWGQDTTPLFGVDVTLDAGLLMRATVFRVVSAATVEWYPLWTGRVESWGDDSYARGQIRTHVVQVVDFLSDLANVPTVVVSNDIPADEYATEVLEGAGWLLGFDFFGDTVIGFLQDLTPAPAVNRLDAVADASGLVWRTRRNGKMIIYPAPWDTTNTNRWTTNPLELAYPGGLVFSYAPSTGEVEYVADDDSQPFGVSRSIAGVLNTFAVTYPDTSVYDPSDPVSQGRYGYRPFTASWIRGNDAVVDDLLADRAFMSRQATPLRTTIDHEGFFPALALLDHLDPVTVNHATMEGYSTVAAIGLVRKVIEERTFRFFDGGDAGALSWQSTVQMDINSTEVLESLLPVEDLALVSTFTPGFGGPSGAEFTWTNPTQPSVTPTDVQVRVLGRSPIWVDIDYPGVGADGVIVNWLTAATAYTFEVRLIRRVNGIITHSSPARAVNFTTPANIVPFPIPGTDPGDTNGEFPQPDDPCDDFEVELQESDDGVTWTTIDSFTGTELEDNGDGTYSLAVDIDNTVFDDDKVYRFRTTCDGVTWTNGPSFDPPDDWTDPCITPPALANPPFDDPDLIVYVPQICAPDIIREAVSGIEGVKGDAFFGLGVVADDPNYRSLLSIDQPEWDDTPGGIVAYGEAPQIAGVVQDKTIMARVNVGAAETCVLFECAAMQITCTATTVGWRPGVTVYKVGSTVSLAGATILDEGTWYQIAATHDYATGDITLYIDGIIDNTVGGTDNVETIVALPIWRVGAPPSSAITDCAVWSVVVDFVQPFTPSDIANLHTWYDASATGDITKNGSNQVTAWAGHNGFGSTLTRTAAASVVHGTNTQNSLPVTTFNDGWMGHTADFMYDTLKAGGAISVFIVANPTSTSATSLETLIDEDNVSDASSQLCFRAQTLSSPANEFIVSGAKAGTGQWLTAGSGTGIVGSGYHLLVCQLDCAPATDTWAFRVDEAAGNSGTFTVNTTTTINQFNMGAMRNNATLTHFLRGHMAEVLIYTRKLNSTEVGQVETYLAAKWGL